MSQAPFRSGAEERGGADRGEERSHPLRIFHPGTRFDDAGSVDRKRLSDPDGVGDVFRGKAVGEEELLVRMLGGDFVELLPGKGLARPPESARDTSKQQSSRLTVGSRTPAARERKARWRV